MEAHEISAAEFKARCLKLLDEVASTGAPIVITKRGRPIARLLPMPPERALFGALKGSVLAQTDLVEPTGEEWDAER